MHEVARDMPPTGCGTMGPKKIHCDRNPLPQPSVKGGKNGRKKTKNMKTSLKFLFGTAIAIAAIGCTKEDAINPNAPAATVSSVDKAAGAYKHAFSSDEYLSETADSELGARIVCTWLMDNTNNPMKLAQATISKYVPENLVNGFTIELADIKAVKGNHTALPEGGNGGLGTLMTYTIDISGTELAAYLQSGEFKLSELRAVSLSGDEMSAEATVEFYEKKD